jgi:toxin YoeB
MTPRFREQYKLWLEVNPKICEKIDEIIRDISAHFGSGMGFPEKLGKKGNIWSRRISQKHRLVYGVHADEKLIELIRCRGHYDDNG